MIRKWLVALTMGVLLSGCVVAPMALIGPMTSGFSTASLIQSGLTSSASYMVKKSTGKTISEHAFDTISADILKQTYFPEKKIDILIAP